VEYEGYESGPQHKRPILHDYSEIKSAMELKAGNIDHWCFEGGDDSCPMCEDPLEGSIPQALNWRRAFIKNNQQTRIAMKENKELEVIFLGDSITEALTGTVGGAKDESLNNIKDVFASQFSKENGGVYEGIALGISGDTSPNLLWRITQNEIPVELNPKIWWITIGMNDLTSTMCSEEVTLMGILRVVEELLFTRPGSTIVINSILPKAITRSGKILKGNFIRNKYFDPIEQVNNRLKRFAANHSNRVRFFDADAIFVQKTRGKVMMRRELFRDKYHPNAEGHKIWGKAQIKLISDILTGKQKETEEDLVSDHSSTSKDTPTIPEQDDYDYSGYDDNLSLYGMWDDDDWS